MSRSGGGVTGGSKVGAGGKGARVAGGGLVVGVAAARVAVVVTARGPLVVVGAAGALVVVGVAVVVVLDAVVVGAGGTGRSAAATCRVSAFGVKPAGDAPAQVEAPTSAAARSGFATPGLVRIARIGG
jgi:hypothetical protein